MSTGTVFNILYMVGNNLNTPASEILHQIRHAKILHGDETSISLNGKKVWVWVLYDPFTKNAYYTIRPSRGRSVLQEMLPEWDGIMVCDGWRPYGIFTIQRCWAHILREAKHIWERNKSDDTFHVLECLQKIYKTACDKSNNRDRLQANLYAKIYRLFKKYQNHTILGKFMTKISNAGMDLFRFVVNSDIPSTNNAAERMLREIVVHRKIRGSIRSDGTLFPNSFFR